MTKTVFHLGLILPSLARLYFAKCPPRCFLSYNVFFYSWRWIHKLFPCLSELLRGSSAPSGWFFLWFWVVFLLASFVWYSAEDEPSSSVLHGSSLYSPLCFSTMPGDLMMPQPLVLPSPSPELWETSGSTWVTLSPLVAWKLSPGGKLGKLRDWPYCLPSQCWYSWMASCLVSENGCFIYTVYFV